MATIDSTNIYQQINSAYQSESTASGATQAQEDSELFLQLMIAQLQNQDPTSPTDSQAFMEQIATMNQVESTNNLITAVDNMAASMLTSQSAIQASSMVGQNVLISTDKTLSDESGDVNGMVSLNGSTDDVRLTIKNAQGVVIDTVSLGAYSAGNSDFTWSGGDEYAGQELSITAEAKLADSGAYTQIDTYLDNKVTSVTLGENGVGMYVNTAVGSTAMTNVLRISA